MKTHHPTLTEEIARPAAAPRFAWIALLGAILYASLFLLTSCSTMAGLGEDIQDLGEEVEEAAY